MPNRILLASAVALLAAGPALAGSLDAPIVVPAPAAPVVVPVTPVVTGNDWSGAYVGGQLGFGRLSTEFSATDDEGEEFTEEVLDGNGALYGLHAGYMFDFGSFVAGAEIDFDGTQIGLTEVDEDGEDGDDGAEVAQIDTISRAKLRLGFDAGRVLPYVTAGVARASVSFEDEGDEEIFEDSYNGRFVGVGANFMVSERFMVGVEALRHNFEDTPAFVDDGEDGEDDAGFDTMVDTLTVRGSIRF